MSADLGYFDKWFPTENKKYTAWIAILYVGTLVVLATTIFNIFSVALGFIGFFGMSRGLWQAMQVLETFSSLGSLITLAFFLLTFYLWYKTRLLFYILKMLLGYLVINFLLVIIGHLLGWELAIFVLLIGLGATIYLNIQKGRWRYISKYRRYIYYVLGSWLVTFLGSLLMVGYFISRIFSFTGRGPTNATLIFYGACLLLLYLLPVICQHYIFRREQAMGTTFYQTFRLLNSVPVTALFLIFGISSLVNVGTVSGDGMFQAFDFDYTGGAVPTVRSSLPQDKVVAQPEVCPHCQAPLSAGASFCSQCGTPIAHCPTCGKIVAADAKFCPACGAYLLKNRQKEPARDSAPQERQTVSVPTSTLKRGPALLENKKFLAATAVAVVVILAGVAYGLFGSEETTPKNAVPVLTPKEDSRAEDGIQAVPIDEKKKEDKPAATKKITASDAAQQAFLDYHQAITSHDIQSAFQHLDSNFQQAVGGYEGYAAGYKDTLSSEVVTLQKTAATEQQEVVSFTLKAKDRIPGSKQVKVQNFSGQATLVKVGNDWKINEIQAQKTGEYRE